MTVSLRGTARRFENRTGALSVRNVFFGGGAGARLLHGRLEGSARREISFAVSECIFAWTARYEQTWSHVRIRIQLNPDAGISAETMATLRQTWATGIRNKWSNRFAIGRRGESPCMLTFDVDFVTSNAHHVVQVRVGPGPTNMTLWHTTDSGDVAAHEFGHMHGNPDEYTAAACPNRSPVNTGTVMDTNSDVVPQRLMERLATNVGSNIV